MYNCDDSWGIRGNSRKESRYDTFKFSWQVANDFYSHVSNGEECLSLFLKELDCFCHQFGISYLSESFSNAEKKGIKIQLKPGICYMSLFLNQDNEPEAISIRAFGFHRLKVLRDSIWDTK